MKNMTMNARVIETGIDTILQKYKANTPTANKVLNTLQNNLGYKNAAAYDHLAFRSFGLDKFGIQAIGDVLSDMGFTQGNYFNFTKKKLKATWFAPPLHLYHTLPRIFISEIKLPELSAKSQKIIDSYVLPVQSQMTSSTLWTSILTGTVPWATPTYQDYEVLAAESEYAAWVLAHGYLLNHFALATHRMHTTQGHSSITSQVSVAVNGDSGSNTQGIYAPNLSTITDQLIHAGYPMNSEGSLIKVSPDELLLQSSTIADMCDVKFADNITRSIPGAYVEFVERKVLAMHQHMPSSELKEHHRRDGFETDNADKIFESTNMMSRNSS